MSGQFENQSRLYWNPLVAGLALGAVLLTTFVLTGHGLGATGFTTRLVAWFGMNIAPNLTEANEYLGGMVEDGKPLSAWITWEVIGLAIGALISAILSKRLKIQLDGKKILGGKGRPLTALVGGIAAGFGARVSAGCTSGLGLSGAATLSLAGFSFMATFFIAGLVFSRFMKESTSV
jgi:uncharacterized membrane protein YedE/YeeE